MPALFPAELRMGHEAQQADAIVEVDEDRPAPGHVLPVIIGHAGRADGAAAPVDEHDHRKPIPGLRLGRGPEVQIEAVLPRRFLAEIVVDVVRPQHLDAFRPLAVGVPDPVPAHGLGRAPAQVLHRRPGEGHPQIGLHPGGQARAGQLPPRGLHRVPGIGDHGGRGQGRAEGQQGGAGEGGQAEGHGAFPVSTSSGRRLRIFPDHP